MTCYMQTSRHASSSIVLSKSTSDIIDLDNLDMIIFSRNVFFQIFDLSNFFFSNESTHHRLWQNLLIESMQFFRNETASFCSSLESFKVLRYFASNSHRNKVVVFFEDVSISKRVVCNKYETLLHAKKCYLMVDYFGDLGRALSKWMMTRETQIMCFLSRSIRSRQACSQNFCAWLARARRDLETSMWRCSMFCWCWIRYWSCSNADWWRYTGCYVSQRVFMVQHVSRELALHDRSKDSRDVESAQYNASPGSRQTSRLLLDDMFHLWHCRNCHIK